MSTVRPEAETAKLKLKAERILKQRKKAGQPLGIREIARATGLGAETVSRLAEQIWPGTRKQIKSFGPGLGSEMFYERPEFQESIRIRTAVIREWKKLGQEGTYPREFDLDAIAEGTANHFAPGAWSDRKLTESCERYDRLSCSFNKQKRADSKAKKDRRADPGRI